jgi:peptidoglycan/xylan/chitin deacetylase (PgdA/CDA1 family)
LQLDEIKQSKVDLEQMLNRPVTSFSYPFGDRTAQTIALAKTAGFQCACSTNQSIISRKSNRFDLPRFAVDDWNAEEFSKQLSRWFHY